MEFTKHDLANSTNLMKALGKGEFKLDGNEVLALAEVFKWVGRLHQTIQFEVEASELKKKKEAEQAEKPLTELIVEPKSKLEESPKPNKESRKKT